MYPKGSHLRTVLLILIIGFLVVSSYLGFGKKYSCPSFLFCFPIFISLIDGLLLYQEWKYNLDILTVIVVVGGTVAFVLGCFFIHIITVSLNRRTYSSSSLCFSKFNALDLKINANIYYLFALISFILSIFTFYEEKKFVSSFGYPSDTIPNVIGSYNELTKFGDSRIVFRGLGAYAYEINFAIALLSAYLFSRECFCFKDNKRRFLSSFLCFFVSSLSLLTTGSRSVAITVFVVFLISYLLMAEKMGLEPSFLNTKVKHIFYILAAFFIAGIAFLFVLYGIGRQGGSSDSTLFYDISIYIGAPFKNLDIAITQGFKTPNLFGEHSFKNLYQTLMNFGFINEFYSTDFGFQSIGKYFLGNVYTIFYSPLVDFGFVGCFMCLFLCGVVSQFIYEISFSNSVQPYIPFSVILYGMFAYNIIFSFFSSMILEMVSTIWLKKIVFVSILIFIFNYLYTSDNKRPVSP